MGNVCILKKDYRQAIDYFKRAVDINPKSHKFRINLARAYFEAGKKFKARNEYNIAVKEYPGYKRRYAYLGVGINTRAADPEERLGYNLWDE